MKKNKITVQSNTNTDILITNIVEKLHKKSESPGKKTLQKMVFLMKAKGLEIDCEYGIHFYGPYSADLDFAIQKLVEEKILEIEYTSTSHKISVLDEHRNSDIKSTVIDDVIDLLGKEKPTVLELYATAVYAFQKTQDKSKICDGVKKLKGEKYSGREIDQAIKFLESAQFIS